MRTVRHSVFETNSSSCHVLALLTQDEMNDLLERNAMLYVSSAHAGPEDDNIAVVVNYKEFVSEIMQFLCSMLEHAEVKKHETAVHEILLQYWQDEVKDCEHSYVERKTNDITLRYLTLSEWDKLPQNIAYLLRRRLNFLRANYRYKDMLENPVVRQIKHEKVYAISWEKDY